MLRMDEINKIKKSHIIKGKSKNQIAKETNRSWATVDSAVKIAPEGLKTKGQRPGRRKTVITGSVEQRINDFFDDEVLKTVHRKQRYTATYLFNELTKEGIYKGSDRQFRKAVKRIRKQRELEKQPPKSFLKLEFTLGQYLQVDHGPVEIILSGIRTSGYLFAAAIPGKPIRYCQVYLTKASESWGDFHEKAFAFYGGVFNKSIYDNDSVLVTAATGEPTPFFVELQGHYDFEGILCNKASGWEKGAVENSVGFCRRNYLPGCPEFDSLKSANEHLETECQQKLNEIDQDSKTYGETLRSLTKDLSPQPGSKDWGRWLEGVSVNSQQLISYKNYKYSVPEKYVGAVLRAFVTSFEIKIFDGHEQVACHKRKYFEKENGLILDHYLGQLLRKPRAFEFAKVVLQEKFSRNLLELMARLHERLGSFEGNKDFVKILLLKRTSTIEEFNYAVDLGLSYGGVNYSSIQCVLQQMQVSQNHSQLILSQLPETMKGHSVSFDLSAYSTLCQEVTNA